MQTFLPSPDFEETASILDQKRLGKQRVETLQIMGSLANGTGWINHPATLMWKGYEWALMKYQYAICTEWHIMRGFQDTCLEKTIALYYANPWWAEQRDIYPWWLGDDEFHAGHQSNLLRKDPDWYRPMFPGVRDDLPYSWPTDM